MYDSHWFILVSAAMYLAALGLIMKTHDFMYAILFKLVPLVIAFTLGLMAFKVI